MIISGFGCACAIRGDAAAMAIIRTGRRRTARAALRARARPVNPTFVAHRARFVAVFVCLQFGLLGWVGFIWGVGGLVAGLTSAVARLFPLAIEPWLIGMTPFQMVAYAASVVFIGYSEGYRGFQKQFSPRVVVRAVEMGRNPKWSWVLLAPLFCAGHFAATKKRLIVSWSITAGVVVLIVMVRWLDPVWRGIVDGGVVVGLSWGTVAIVVFTVQALAGKPPNVAHDIA
jgi:hypothetical protein